MMMMTVRMLVKMMMVVVILMMSEISLEIWMFEDIIIYIDDHNIDGDNTGA